ISIALSSPSTELKPRSATPPRLRTQRWTVLAQLRELPSTCFARCWERLPEMLLCCSVLGEVSSSQAESPLGSQNTWHARNFAPVSNTKGVLGNISHPSRQASSYTRPRPSWG